MVCPIRGTPMSFILLRSILDQYVATASTPKVSLPAVAVAGLESFIRIENAQRKLKV